MFYLEDFMEKLEILPQEIRNCITEIGKLDLQIENSMNNIKINVNTLFSKANTMNLDDLNDGFKAIMKQGDKDLDESDKKMKLTDDVKQILATFLKHLDLELKKFKSELEVDKSGTTELIEKKILDSDQSNTTYHEQNKYETNGYIFGDTEEVLNNISSVNEKSIEVTSNSSSSEDLVESFQPDTSSINSQMDPFPFSLSTGHMGAGCSAIAGVVSEAIVSTRKSSRRRMAALDKTCNDQIKDKSDCLSKEFHIKSNINKTKNNKKLRTGIGCKKISANKDKSIDSVEPRYCLCNKKAYGTMVACDNKMCSNEWFHYVCVGVTKPPHGKWYCPKCVIKPKRKRQR